MCEKIHRSGLIWTFPMGPMALSWTPSGAGRERHGPTLTPVCWVIPWDKANPSDRRMARVQEGFASSMVVKLSPKGEVGLH